MTKPKFQHKYSFVAVLLAACLLSPDRPVYAAEAPNFNIQLEGRKSGAFDGGKLLSLEHQMTVPADSKSGLATGKRKPTTVKIIKEFDAGAVKMIKAFVNNEDFPSVTLHFPVSGKAGNNQEADEIRLSNAGIASYKILTPDRAPSGLLTLHPNLRATLVEFEFDYLSIEWLHVNGGVKAADNWHVIESEEDLKKLKLKKEID